MISAEITLPATRTMNSSPESGVEHELRRHARIAATQDRRVRLLPFCQVGENLLLHGWEARLAANEPRVAFDEPGQRLISRHDRGLEIGSTPTCSTRNAGAR